MLCRAFAEALRRDAGTHSLELRPSTIDHPAAGLGVFFRGPGAIAGQVCHAVAVVAPLSLVVAKAEWEMLLC